VVPSELGKNLRDERLRRKETQGETAARFDIAQSSYHRWESGENKPDDGRLADIAHFLGRSTEEVWKMIHEGKEPTSLELLRTQVAQLQRDNEELRSLRRQVNNELPAMREEMDLLRAMIERGNSKVTRPKRPSS
jgi:transcriptional regulator with XRE-family HTH domain